MQSQCGVWSTAAALRRVNRGPQKSMATLQSAGLMIVLSKAVGKVVVMSGGTDLPVLLPGHGRLANHPSAG